MSARRTFLKNKNSKRLFTNLKKPNAISLNGYFPLYKTQKEAIDVSPELDFHIHKLEGVEYYMPNGLGGPGSGLQFHGDHNDEIIIKRKDVIIGEKEEVVETTEEVVETNEQEIVEPVVVQQQVTTSINRTSRTAAVNRSGGY